MDTSISPLKRTFLSVQYPLFLRIEEKPQLAPPLESELIIRSIDQPSHEPSPPYSYLPSPPLRVSTIPRNQNNSSGVLDRASSVPVMRERNVDSGRLIHSWSDLSHHHALAARTEPSAGGTGYQHLQQINELFARTCHSTETFDDDTVSPDPLMGIALGPHHPPFPIEPVSVHPIEPSFFPDPLTEFMEDRIILFRPTCSQNNVESLLNNTHPYQAQPDVKRVVEAEERNAWSRWLNSRAVVNSPGVAASLDAAASNAAAPIGVEARGVGDLAASYPGGVLSTKFISQSYDPINSANALSGTPGSDAQSSVSFLPRNHSLEPPVLNMDYTPRAAPIADLSKDSPTTEVGCVWCL